MKRSDRNFDTRDVAAYTAAEAARFIRLPVATLRSWVVGRHYPKARGLGQFSPLIKPARREPLFLSFWNLIEAHVLRSLRTEHGVALTEVRKALKYAEGKLEIERLLLSKQLSTDAGQMFLHHYGELINLSASGQLALRKVFDEHLKRVEWDKWQFPVRLYPFLMSDGESAVRPIMIDPAIAFGRPVIARLGISTQAIAERIDAGETVKDLVSDYELEPDEIEQAVLYERAA